MGVRQDDIDAGWDAARRDNPESTVRYFADLLARHPDDARAAYEYASALDFAGAEDAAASEYERTFALGIPPQIRHEALIQYGSTLRNVGRHAEAVATLRGACRERPDDPAAAAFLALALAGTDRSVDAVALLLRQLLDRVSDPLLQHYRVPLAAYADELAPAAER